jgi:hypothetical protein
MSSGGGLSRRRGAPAGVHSSLNDDDEPRTISPAPGSSSAASGSKGTSSTASSAAVNGSSQRAGGGGGTFEGRGKVAYDPRDFEDKDEKEGVPRLTLLEEILLLGLKDNQVGPPHFLLTLSWRARVREVRALAPGYLGESCCPKVASV